MLYCRVVDICTKPTFCKLVPNHHSLLARSHTERCYHHCYLNLTHSLPFVCCSHVFYSSLRGMWLTNDLLAVAAAAYIA